MPAAPARRHASTASSTFGSRPPRVETADGLSRLFAVNVLAPSLDAADRAVQRLKALPEVDRVMTLADFVPAGQTEKLAMIAQAASQPWLISRPDANGATMEHIEFSD